MKSTALPPTPSIVPATHHKFIDSNHIIAFTNSPSPSKKNTAIAQCPNSVNRVLYDLLHFSSLAIEMCPEPYVRGAAKGAGLAE